MASKDLPSWISSLVEKGSSLSDCLQLLEAVEKLEMKNEEREERRAERDLHKAKLEHEMKLQEIALKEKELELASESNVSVGSGGGKQWVKLPKFEEGHDVDVFLRSFEKMASLHKWSKPDWAIHLVPLLTGKALEAYSRLDSVYNGNYERIKEAILERYQLTAEAYREKYRFSKQQSDESFREYSVRLERYLSHWCEREEVGGDYGRLYDLVLREQLLRYCSKELQVWVHEHKPKTVAEVVQLVEAYQIAHKNVRLSMGGGMTDKGHVDKGKVGGNKSGGSVVQAKSQVICYYCDREGHISRDCPVKQQKGGKTGGHPGKKMDKVGMCVSSEKSLDGTRSDVIGERFAVSEIIRLPGVGNGGQADVESDIAIGQV